MNLLKKAMIATFFVVLISSTIQCTSYKVASAPKPFSVIELQEPVVFQEWYAGINIGGTGVNLFIPKFENGPIILVDSIYFRNMKGKLIDIELMYSVILKNDSPYYDPNPSNELTNPFNLTSNECIISYTENGEIKYLKTASIVEKAGTYYENGPPSMHLNIPSNIIATVEED